MSEQDQSCSSVLVEYQSRAKITNNSLFHTTSHNALSDNTIWDMRSTLDMDQHTSDTLLKQTMKEQV